VGIARGKARRGVALLLAGCALVSAGAVGQATAAKGPAGKGKGTGAKGGGATRAGRLDRGFNGDGKLVTVLPVGNGGNGSPTYRAPFEFAAGHIAMAAAGGGKLVVASNRAIVEYLPNGRPNPRFGGNGAVPVGVIEGLRFRLADITVDSRGRVLIAGTTRPNEELGMIGPPVPGPIPSIATIRRYNPDGQLDPSFGVEGVVNTEFGAQPPSAEGKAYPDAAVTVVGLAVDEADRPILAGSAVAEVGLCTPSKSRFQRSQGIVARLAVNGAPDPTFAEGGIRSIGGLSWLGLPSPTSDGIFAAGSKVDPCPRGGGPAAPSVLTSLTSDGGIAQGFSGGGFWSRPFTRISDLAVTPSGKLILLTRTIELSGGEWVESAGEAIRLRSNGSFDTGFGRGGRADVQLPRHSAVAAIAVDAKGRVLLAGTVLRQLRQKKGAKGEAKSQLRFLLIRTTTGGEADDRFGRDGRVTTAFGRRSNVIASDVLVDPAGRVVVGGKFSGPATGDGFAVARYLGGR
jgi:uncharacterized delta-60 repeat protein